MGGPEGGAAACMPNSAYRPEHYFIRNVAIIRGLIDNGMNAGCSETNWYKYLWKCLHNSLIYIIMSEAAISQAIVSKLADSLSNGSPGIPNFGDLIPSTLIASAIAAEATQAPEAGGSSGTAQATVPDSIKRNEQNGPVDTVENLLGDVLEKLKPIIETAKEKTQDQVGDESEKIAEELLSKILNNLGRNDTSELSSLLQDLKSLTSQLDN